MYFPILVFFIVFVFLSLLGIGAGYLLYWILPISLDHAILAGMMLMIATIYFVSKLFMSLNDKMDEEEDGDEILIPIRNVGKWGQPYVRKKKRK
jgi:Kef-type K+ transport system membrane component KefB